MKQETLEWSVYQKRMEIIQTTRFFFNNNGFTEVDPPLLTPYPTLDSNIHSVRSLLHLDQKKYPMFLHTSPEHYMKKLLAAGAEKIYFLGKVFRNDECTQLHNPEFTMLEWYRTNATYHDIIQDTEKLIQLLSKKLLGQKSIVYDSKKINLSSPFQKITLRDLFLQNANLDLDLNHTLDDLRNNLKKNKIPFDTDDTWETLFFRLFLEKIEPHLGSPKPTFVTDYPLSMALMAKPKEDKPDWVERVELYISGVELANGYSELTDSQEQFKRFQMEQQKRFKETGIQYPIDFELVEALKRGIPPSAGMALGVDRLVMLLTNKKRIEDVILFPFRQMKNSTAFKTPNPLDNK